MKVPFRSFVWAGFECTAARVSPTRRLQLLYATKHDSYVIDDYKRVKEIGIQTVREGLSWSAIDQHGTYVFDQFIPLLEAGVTQNMQQVWDLNHFDYPDDVDPFSDEFIDRFVTYALHAVKFLLQYQQPLWIVPLNEISFFSWISADKGYWAPFTHGRNNGLRLKKQLCRAHIAAIQEIKKQLANVFVLVTDPYMQRKQKPDILKAIKSVEEFNSTIRYEAWDILLGKKYPELGGSNEMIDCVGLNYYIHNQEWVGKHVKSNRLTFQMMALDEPERISLADMIETVYNRYQKPIVISETGSFDTYRFEWWSTVLEQVTDAWKRTLPIWGVCAYPALDRPDSAEFLLPKSGLWDFDQKDPDCIRLPQRKLLKLLSSYSQGP